MQTKYIGTQYRQIKQIMNEKKNHADDHNTFVFPTSAAYIMQTLYN